MTHDPLCLADPTTTNERCHYCSLIARVREDERNAFGAEMAMKRVAEKEQAFAEGIVEGRRRSGKESSRSHKDAYQSGYAAALRDAVEAVRQYRDDTHRHVGVFACIPDKGDRCGMTAALTVAAQRVEALGGER